MAYPILSDYFLNTVFSCKLFPLRMNIYSLITIGKKIPGAESLLLLNAVYSRNPFPLMINIYSLMPIGKKIPGAESLLLSECRI